MTVKNALSSELIKSLPQILDEMEYDIRPTAEIAARVVIKSLPQILDDMEENIRLAAEAARGAGEAARAATKASMEGAKRAVEARRAGEKAAEEAVEAAQEASKTANRVFSDIKAELLQRIESLEERVKNLEAIPKEEVIVLREISRDEAKTEIERLFAEGNTLYYSDITKELRLDIEIVVDICEEL